MPPLEFRRDVSAGIREAWFYVKWFMGQAVIAIVLGGFVFLRRYPFVAIGLFPLYIVGGVTAGAIAGYLLPWCTRPIGAAATGVLAILPFCIGVVLLIAPTVGWSPNMWLVALIGALFYGIVGGLILFRVRVRRM